LVGEDEGGEGTAEQEAKGTAEQAAPESTEQAARGRRGRDGVVAGGDGYEVRGGFLQVKNYWGVFAKESV
jgi:hypothetical protein